MNDSVGDLLAILWSFGLLSLFAIGGAASAIPEIHRIAVDINHWMTDDQFADVEDNTNYWTFVVCTWLPVGALIYLAPRLG